MEKLINDTMESCEQYIPKLIDACLNNSFNLQSANEGEAISLMPSIIEGIQWVVEAVQGMQKCRCQLSIEWNDFIPLLRQLTEAVENSDFVLLADVLQHEIVPALRDWLSIIIRLKGNNSYVVDIN